MCLIPLHLPEMHSPRQTIVLFAAGGALLLIAALWSTMRRPVSAEERERLRRENLAETGRVVDGALLDVQPSMAHPQMVLYRYRVAGVMYECTQEISAVAHRVHARGLTAALEMPIQVRYRRGNPGDSIVVAESWNGLWSLPARDDNSAHPGTGRNPGLH